MTSRPIMPEYTGGGVFEKSLQGQTPVEDIAEIEETAEDEVPKFYVTVTLIRDTDCDWVLKDKLSIPEVQEMIEEMRELEQFSFFDEDNDYIVGLTTEVFFELSSDY